MQRIMKTKLIQTKDYLLLIDEEAEIKEGDLFWYRNYKVLLCTGINNTFILTDNKNPKHSHYGQPPQLCKKVIAYYPLTKETKELDLPLLPNPFEKEIDETTLFKNLGHECFIKMKELNPSGGIKEFIRIAVEFGYKAAQSNKQFSLEDMYRVAIEVANRVSRPEYGEIININEIVDTYIQSLSTQQLPKEFIPEYQRVRDWDSRDVNGDYNSKLVLKTITNSEGKKELVGTYK